MPTFPLDYSLPPELIAQEPIEPRDAARLLVIHRAAHTLTHHHFRDLPSLLSPGDLLVLNGTHQGACIPLTRERTLLGRGSHCDICINLPSASREHACLTAAHGQYYLEDLGSRNGTFLNTLPARNTKVHSGDEIRAGGHPSDRVEPILARPADERRGRAAQCRFLSQRQPDPGWVWPHGLAEELARRHAHERD